MRDLLSANLLRLKKNNAFWGSMGVSFGLALATVIDVYRVAQAFGGTTSVDGELFKYAASSAFWPRSSSPCSSAQSTATEPSATN